MKFINYQIIMVFLPNNDSEDKIGNNKHEKADRN